MDAEASSSPSDPRGLETEIGYTFADRRLLELALTHPAFNHGTPGAENNQRLEFLGDAVLQIASSEALFQRFPEDREGELTRKRASLINAEYLAEVGNRIDLRAYLVFGPTRAAFEGRALDSAVGDACESLFGAIFLDGGLTAVRTVFNRLFDLGSIRAPSRTNPKGTLQEWQQERDPNQPVVYEITDTSGPGHALIFTATVRIGERILGSGQGPSKKAAEFAAAEAALKHLPTPD